VRAALGMLAALIVAVGSLAGCGDGEEREPPEVTEGRACLAIPFDSVEAVLGVRFDTNGSAHLEQTYTCVLTRADAPLPDLMLAMSSSTADEVIFTVSVTPSMATPVPDLGRIAYQVTVPPGTASDSSPTGPGLEIGWLSAVPRLMLLRYTWPVGAADADVAALAPKLLELARGIEQAVLTGPTLG